MCFERPESCHVCSARAICDTAVRPLLARFASPSFTPSSASLSSGPSTSLRWRSRCPSARTPRHIRDPLTRASTCTIESWCCPLHSLARFDALDTASSYLIGLPRRRPSKSRFPVSSLAAVAGARIPGCCVAASRRPRSVGRASRAEGRSDFGGGRARGAPSAHWPCRQDPNDLPIGKINDDFNRALTKLLEKQAQTTPKLLLDPDLRRPLLFGGKLAGETACVAASFVIACLSLVGVKLLDPRPWKWRTPSCDAHFQGHDRPP